MLNELQFGFDTEKVTWSVRQYLRNITFYTAEIDPRFIGQIKRFKGEGNSIVESVTSS